MPTYLECYSGQLNQVFVNILSNAIEALEIGTGDNRLSTLGSEFLTPNYTLPFSNPQAAIPTIKIRIEMLNPNVVAVRIADNAPGMTEEVQTRLFDPFFTTKPVGKGTGLGLSISYGIIVQKHQGALKCFSEKGRGTEFSIEIPIRQAVDLLNTQGWKTEAAASA